MVKRDPLHEQSRKTLAKLDAVELRRCIAIEDRKSPEHVASEVLSSFVRARFGQGTPVLDAAATTLYARLMKAVGRYFRENPKWDAVVRSSSETLAEATSSAWAAMVLDKSSISLAEVRFWPFVEARVLDYLRGQLAQKNARLVSLEAMSATDDEGNEVPYENTLAADKDDEPDAMLATKLQSENVNKVYLELSPIERRAVFMRLECEYSWDEIADLLKCSVPTARKHYNRGMARLLGAME